MEREDFLFEDGHCSRSEDITQDDLDHLHNLKNDFIELLDRAARVVGSSRVMDSGICAEQHFDDMLDIYHTALQDELGATDNLPKSKWMKRWEMERSAERAEASATMRDRPITNPSTFQTLGKDL